MKQIKHVVLVKEKNIFFILVIQFMYEHCYDDPAQRVQWKGDGKHAPSKFGLEDGHYFTLHITEQ